MAQNNSHSLKGVIFELKSQDIRGKKDPLQVYKKYNLIIEADSADEKMVSYTDKKTQEVVTKTNYKKDNNLIKFECFNPRSFDMDAFAVKDFVDIRFFIEGKPFVFPYGDRKGESILINRNVITFCKHADLDSGHSNHKGKITVDSMSNPDDLKTAEVFRVPDPDDDTEGLSDLPFIITALIGIGTLIPFMI